MCDPLAVGLQLGREVLAMAAGEAMEALFGPLGADEAGGEHQQVFDPYGKQTAAASRRGDFLADEAACLPVFGDMCLTQDRHPEEQCRIAHQRQGHAKGQAAEAEAQAAVVHPAQPGEHVQRPAQQGQDQRIEPDCRTGGQAGEHASAVGLFPIQCADHRRCQLGDSGEGDLADGSQRSG